MGHGVVLIKFLDDFVYGSGGGALRQCDCGVMPSRDEVTLGVAIWFRGEEGFEKV